MNPITLGITNEFGNLKTVVVSTGNSLVDSAHEIKLRKKYGSSMDDEERFHPESAYIDVAKARQQHLQLLNTLESRGITLVYTRDIPEAAHQIFTRDVGFVIGDTFYFANLGDGIRQREEKGLLHLKHSFSKYRKIRNGIVEGGDVFVHERKVFVGITQYSTNMEGFMELKAMAAEDGYECIPIRCNENVLHLDCRFNIVGPELALLAPEDIDPEDVRVLESHFDIIEVKKGELITLAPNLFVLSPHEILVDRRNERITGLLSSKNYRITALDYSEITKLWGSVRCTTLPLYRD